MTRKKFIKMLMSAGMSRNDAADCATLVQDAERPYFWALGDLLNFHRQDFCNPLAVPSVRRTIIHGYNDPYCRFCRAIAEENKRRAVQKANAYLTGQRELRTPRIVKVFDVSLVASGGYPLGGGQE